jgi:hypothetical protein
MSMIVNMPIGGYPLAMYGMIALTTGILAYATISSGSGSAEESATGSADGKSMFSGLFGSSEPKDETKDESKGSEGGILDSLGELVSSNKESNPATPTLGGGGSRRRKNRKTKNKRRKNRSEKRNA